MFINKRDILKKFEIFDLKKSVRNEANGIVLSVESNQNGFQFYTGNYIDVGDRYSCHDGFCLECHNLPDSVNKVKIGNIFTVKPRYEAHGHHNLVWSITQELAVGF